MSEGATSPMQGHRVMGPSERGAFVFGGDDVPYLDFEPGDYAIVIMDRKRQVWFRDPFGHLGRCSTHTITENQDGTVTVDPSILDTGPEPPFHGFLRGGVWTW